MCVVRVLRLQEVTSQAHKTCMRDARTFGYSIMTPTNDGSLDRNEGNYLIANIFIRVFDIPLQIDGKWESSNASKCGAVVFA